MTDPAVSLWPNTRKLAVAMFSMPAGIGLLDKYDDRLGLSDLLKRIVENYEVVITLLWRWIGRLVPLPPDFDILFWSFFLLILTPVLIEMLRNHATGQTWQWGLPRFWGIASSVAFLGYAVTFGTTAELGLALVDLAVFMLIFIPGITIIAVLAGAFWGTEKEPAPKWLKWTLSVALFLGFMMLSRFSGDLSSWLFSGLYDRLGLVPSGGVRGLAVLASLALAAVFAFGNLRSPAYVFFWALGLWFLDTLALRILPAVNEALDGAIPS